MQDQGYLRPVLDLTGGKVPMSIGAFMAAEERGVPSLYVTTEFDRERNPPRMATARMRCISSPGG